MLKSADGWSEFTNYQEINCTVTQTINLVSGTNWVSFNVEITLDDLKAALVAASPNAAITIKSQTQKATYNPSNGRWTGQLDDLEPGKGYIYNSSATEDRTFVFPTGASTNSRKIFLQIPEFCIEIKRTSRP